jgi:hypothetical protein
MKKVEYQNHIRKVYVENQDENHNGSKRKRPIEIKLIHEDWACKLSSKQGSRLLPVFSTKEMTEFGVIGKNLNTSSFVLF